MKRKRVSSLDEVNIEQAAQIYRSKLAAKPELTEPSQSVAVQTVDATPANAPIVRSQPGYRLTYVGGIPVWTG